ncbi:MAG: O-antigen ligase family protein [Maribacter sp.]|nr:O-antigen ligase family protein [Maribacter sp.]
MNKIHLSVLLHQNLVKVLILLLGLCLPFKDQLTTIVIVILVFFSMLSFRKNFKSTFQLSDFRLLWLPSLFLVPRIIGFFTGDFHVATDELVRSLPLLLIPFVFLGVSNQHNSTHIEKQLYFGLLAGIFLIMLVCEFFVFKSLIANDQPLGYLMRWRYMNFNFTNPIGVHPAYLGLIIIYIQVKTLFEPIFGKRINLLIFLILTILLFQLIARNAIAINFLLLIGYGIANKTLRILILTLATLFIAIILLHPSDYLRNKYLYIFNRNDSILEDTRFGRLEASIRVFKQSPILGVGPGNDMKLRREEFLKLGEEVAYINNYNAHNQYFEYLVTSGIIGFLCFVAPLSLAGFYLFKIRHWSNLFLILAFGLACLSESVLERSLGIKYFGILMGVVLISLSKNLSLGIRNKAE